MKRKYGIIGLCIMLLWILNKLPVRPPKIVSDLKAFCKRIDRHLAD